MLQFALALAVVSTAPSTVPAGTHLIYRGSFAPVKEDGLAPKQFELQLLTLDAEGTKIAWTVREEGRGAWSWPERFGVLELGADRRIPPVSAPSLLVQREDGRNVAPILLPWIGSPEPPAVGVKWSEGRIDAEVTGDARRGDHECWEIDFRSPIGHKRTTWVARDSGLIVEFKEIVFMGPGQQHELHAKLAERKQLPAAELEKTVAAFAAWETFRQTLNREPRTEKADLTAEQMELVRSQLPKLKDQSPGPLAELLAAAASDIRQQKDRAGALSSLQSAAVGKTFGEFELSDLTGKKWSAADLKDKVVVLHFWEYRDAPLEEPYGQTAYLDFLKRRLKDRAVVLGVNVDPRLADSETRRAAISSAKKFRDFMNLTYPILLDDGALLKRVGDPRPTGAKLPLFLVVGGDGKTAAYHAGHYTVHRDRGLEELDAVVTKALER